MQSVQAWWKLNRCTLHHLTAERLRWWLSALCPWTLPTGYGYLSVLKKTEQIRITHTLHRCHILQFFAFYFPLKSTDNDSQGVWHQNHCDLDLCDNFPPSLQLFHFAVSGLFFVVKKTQAILCVQAWFTLRSFEIYLNYLKFLVV